LDREVHGSRESAWGEDCPRTRLTVSRCCYISSRSQRPVRISQNLAFTDNRSVLNSSVLPRLGLFDEYYRPSETEEKQDERNCIE
jgi:hypothetical protein